MKIVKYLKNPFLLIKRYKTKKLLGKYGQKMDDETYLKKVYKLQMGKDLNLENPQTFNEKLQWLKLYDRKPEYTQMVDKYAAKEYVADKIGEEYIIKTLGVWDKFDDIDFSTLPNQFALKTTHDSGGVVICKDKATFDIKKAKEKLEKSLKRKYYYVWREWPYKNVKPRIIAEEFLTDKSGGLIDYKFFCFNGVADCVMVCIDRHINDTKFYFFDKNWELKRLNIRGKNAPEGFTLPKPKNMNKMFEIAEELSKGIKYVRVDLYESNDNIYFGELTFFPDSGFDSNILEEADTYWGNLIDLTKIKGEK